MCPLTNVSVHELLCCEGLEVSACTLDTVYECSTGTQRLSLKVARDEGMCLLCRHMKREGTITFNGSPSTKRLKRITGFVMQVCFAAPPWPAVRMSHQSAAHAASCNGSLMYDSLHAQALHRHKLIASMLHRIFVVLTMPVDMCLERTF